MRNAQETKLKVAEASMKNFVGFSAALQRVHSRLIAEGYKIVNGKIVSPSGEIVYNKQ